jgi:hypothetical protein
MTAAPAFAQLAVWTGDGDGTSWGDANNWSPAVVPCGGPFDVTIDLPGALVQLNQVCTVNSLTLGISTAMLGGEQRALGGTTPPVLEIGAASTLEAEGSITLEESSGVRSTATSSSAQGGTAEIAETHYHIRVGGNWDNQSTTTDYFNLSRLAMLIDGIGPTQFFEVAAKLSCPLDDNLTLKTLAVQSGAVVVFQDARDNNQDGLLPFEVQVARGIGFQAGATVTIDAAGVLYNTLQDDGAAITILNDGFLRSAATACPVQSVHAVIALALVMALAGAVVIHRRRSIA